IQALPSSRELKDFERRLKAIKIDTKDPVKFAASIKEIQTLVSEADQKIKMVRETSENLNGDLKKMDESFKELDQLVKQDIKDLEKHFKLPQIDVGDFSKKLFLKMFAEKLVTVQKYMAIAREYMPPEKSEAEKKADAEEQIVPRPRESGRNYTFPLAKGYPLFWMKKAQVSSEPNGSEYSGRIQGEILDLTSNPVQLGKPTEINISGDFPGQQIMGFSTQITLDHTTDKPKEIMRAAIESFPLEPQKFSDTDSLRFVLTEARGSSQMTAKLENQEIQILLHNKFKDLKYDIDAKSDVVKQILTRISQDIPIITLEARASGTWSNLKIGIRSNLGEEISKGFKRQLDEKLNEAKLKLKQLVDEKVSAERDKLKAEMDKLKGKLTQEVEQVKNQVEQTKKDAENQITQGKKSAEQGQKKQVEEAGKKVLEDLKKKFKIK
ncbi:MAG: TIGR03545 family protein, partial [Bdellovibrionales bacterium]|nr:TIGR03545 family protein [Bdellovibrionales bacterium]